MHTHICRYSHIQRQKAHIIFALTLNLGFPRQSCRSGYCSIGLCLQFRYDDMRETLTMD
jgi:hypothetical protein